MADAKASAQHQAAAEETGPRNRRSQATPDAVDNTAAVTSSQQGDVTVLTLNRPERLNAFTPTGYRQLATQLNNAADDPQVHVVLLTGAGRGFCSGVDVAALAQSGDDITEFSAAFQTVLDALIGFHKPLLAAVHGVAVGFGFTMLLHCDIVVVADDARLRAPFVRLGTTPEAASSALLPRVVGPQRAAELLFTSRWITAEEAVRLGLAVRTVEPTSLVSDACRLAQSIAAQPAAAVVAAKRLLRYGHDHQVRAAIVEETRGALALHDLYGGLGAPSQG
jgi:enoyl-CoA hydratase/carnithine racemase